MALPPLSERGISPVPEVKLTHRMTSQDVAKIARITGGTARPLGINARTYYGPGGDQIQDITYPILDAEIDLVGYPLEVISDTPGAYLKLDGEGYTIPLRNTAVVIGEDSVSFVSRVRLKKSASPDHIAGRVFTIVTVSPQEVSMRRVVVPVNEDENNYGIDDNIRRAVAIVEEAYEKAGHR